MEILDQKVKATMRTYADVALYLLRNRFRNRRLKFRAHINEILELRVVELGSLDGTSLRKLTVLIAICVLMSSGSPVEIQGCLLIQLNLQKLDPATKAK